MAHSKGRKVGRYEICSLLGGPQGEVYLGYDTQLERAVALKSLPFQVASDRSRMRRFIQQAKADAALNHPSFDVLIWKEAS